MSLKILVDNVTSNECRPVLIRRSDRPLRFDRFGKPSDISNSCSSYIVKFESKKEQSEYANKCIVNSFVIDVYNCLVLIIRRRIHDENDINYDDREDREESKEGFPKSMATERWFRLDNLISFMGLSWNTLKLQSNYEGLIETWSHLKHRARFVGNNTTSLYRTDVTTMVDETYEKISWDTLFVRDTLLMHFAFSSPNRNFSLVAQKLLDEVLYPTRLFPCLAVPRCCRHLKEMSSPSPLQSSSPPPPPIPPKMRTRRKREVLPLPSEQVDVTSNRQSKNNDKETEVRRRCRRERYYDEISFHRRAEESRRKERRVAYRDEISFLRQKCSFLARQISFLETKLKELNRLEDERDENERPSVLSNVELTNRKETAEEVASTSTAAIVTSATTTNENRIDQAKSLGLICRRYLVKPLCFIRPQNWKFRSTSSSVDVA